MSDDAYPDFLCGQMLGRLTKWLKLLGYPALVAPIKLDQLGTEDSTWQNFSNQILTRSQDPILQKLYPNATITKIDSDQLNQQLQQLYKKQIIDFAHSTRPFYCTACDSIHPLVEIENKEDFKENIPDRSYEQYEHFYQCRNCKQIFWKGTHWQDIEHKLDSIKETATINKKDA